MRILAIRGENLASLAERFEIDFEAEPLRGAGLFAITGETGAGKSTILDALCLALYDAFPRVAAQGVNEGVPDPSGQIMSASDPRSILRRGAGRGFAEVDFLGRDGERYRARCDLARARGRATGNLQQRVRALHRIDAAGVMVAPVASGVELVKARIVELTDLSFEQFRRTVLLAQGDFDAFLRSDSKERADLLEKITGASIYAEISKRVHARAKISLDALQDLRRRRDEVGLFADDARAALEAERADAESKRAALAAERDGALALLRRHEAITQAETRHAQAQARREAALAALEGLAETRDHLRTLENAEPLRAPFARRADMATALLDAASKETNVRAADASRALALEAALGAEALAAQALAAVDVEIETFGPLWSQAEGLDAQITTAEQETASAESKARAAAQAAVDKAAEEQGLIERTAAATRERDAAREAFERLAAVAPLREGWSEIERMLGERGEAGKALAHGAKRLDALARIAKTTKAELDALDVADAAALAERALLIAQSEERSGALAAMREDESSERRRALAALAGIVTPLTEEARRHARADIVQRRAREELDAARAEEQAGTQSLADARAARERLEARRDEIERLGEIADAATSKAALALREHLVDGAPCPVCGATEHPLADDTATNAVMLELRARRDDLRRDIAAIERAIAETSGRLAGAQARAVDAQRRGEEAQAEARDAMDRYARLRERWPEGVVATAPPAIEEASDTLDSVSREIENESAEIDGRLAKARVLRGEIDLLRQKSDRLLAAIDERRLTRDEARRRLEQASEESAGLAAARARGEESLRAIDRALAPFLPLCGLTAADLDRDLVSATQRLAKMGEDYRLSNERRDQAERSLSELSQRLVALAVEARTLAEAAGRDSDAHEKRAKDLADLRARRAALLDGEPTPSHRARYFEARNTAQRARDDAAAARAQAEAAKAAATRDLVHAEQMLADARVNAETAAAACADALATAAIDEAAALVLLTVSAQERAALRAQLDAAQAAAAAAATEAEARACDLAEALAAGRPEENAEALESRRDAANAGLEALAERLGQIGEKLVADDLAREKSAALAVDIAAAEAAHKSWAEVDAAIGSANGDKFRRFAQSVTLERLVALANHHLETLTSRYRLERSASEAADLGLQIVDRDLCDERRSTRSLSGGERFLASLALALGLCSLEGRDSFVDTLFIDEGFGTLDQATLDVAIDALERLQGQGRKVGVISHVESLRQRIGVQIRVEKRGGGRSAVRIDARAALLV